MLLVSAASKTGLQLLRELQAACGFVNGAQVFADLFSLWFSLGVGLMVLQTGALLAPGLGLSGALLAIFLGTLVGVALLASVGVIGSDTGLSSMAALKLSLGSRGAMLPAVLNVLQLIGWGSFEIIVMRDAASLLGARACFRVWAISPLTHSRAT